MIRFPNSTAATASLLLGFVACGGSPAPTDGGTGDAGRDAPGVWTSCASPSGYAVCGGPNRCAPDTPECMKACTHMPYSASETPLPVALCWNDLFASWRSSEDMTEPCGDGNVRIVPYAGFNGWWCVPFEVGELMVRSGAMDRVSYADGSTFTGAPIPSNAVCPLPGAAKYCGAGCGGCGPNEHCWGLSPIHPVGICLRAGTPGFYKACSSTVQDLCAGGPCFVFRVQSEAQPVADQLGWCLEASICEEVASRLGGTCAYPK